MKYESNNFQFEAEMPWESAGEGIVRQIMGYNDNLMMVKVKFETGAIGTPHTHPHTQTTYVASGVFEFTTDGETKIVRPGDGVYMKPGILHGCICLERSVRCGRISYKWQESHLYYESSRKFVFVIIIDN